MFGSDGGSRVGTHRSRLATRSRGSPGIPGSLIAQPFGQFAAPASTSEASAMAEKSRYLYLRSHPRSFIGLPPFQPVVTGKVTGALDDWQTQSEARVALPLLRPRPRGCQSAAERTLHSASQEGS